MALLKHDFEGITDGATLTGGSGGNTNTAGNNFFNAISGTGGTIIASSSAPYEGVNGMRVFTGTGTNASAAWTGLSLTDFYCELFFRLTALPSASSTGRLLAFRGAGGAGFQGSVFISNVGGTTALRIENSTPATVISGSALSPNIYYRLGLHFHTGTASDGTITFRRYDDPTAAIGSFTEEIVASTAWTMPSATVGEIDIGASGATTSFPIASNFLEIDYIQAGQTTGYYGPLIVPTQTVLPDADIDMTGWSGASAGQFYTKINDSSDATVISAIAS